MSDAFSPKDWVLLSSRHGSIRELSREMLFIGRCECDLLIDSPSIDNRHSVLCFNPAEKVFFIKDLNTTHGTYINDRKIPSQSYVKLDQGDKIRFGFAADIFILYKRSLLTEHTVPAILNISPNALKARHWQSSPACEAETPAEAKSSRLPPTASRSAVAMLNEKTASVTCGSDYGAGENNLNTEKQAKANRQELLAYNVSSNEPQSSLLTSSSNPPHQQRILNAGSAVATTDSAVSPTSPATAQANRSMNSSEPAADHRKSPISMAMAFTISFDEDIAVKKKPPPAFISRPRPQTSKSHSSDGRSKSSQQQSDHHSEHRSSRSASAAGSSKKMNGRARGHISLASSLHQESLNGQLSDSATYLIQRMLASEPQDEDSPSSMSSSGKEPETGACEKDSGVCDDKSETGTYTVENQEEDVEQARNQIDQVFGVLSDETQNLVPNFSPESIANARQYWLTHCQPAQAVNKSCDNSTEVASGGGTPSSPAADRSRQQTFTRPSRRSSVDEASDNSRSNASSYSNHHQRKQQQQQTADGANDYARKTRAHRDDSSPCSGRSPSSAHSTSTTTVCKARKVGIPYSPLARRKLSAGVAPNDSEEGSEPESFSSGKCKSDSHTVSSSLKLNRAFALRRARLGIETPGVPLNLSKDKPKKTDQQPANRLVSGLNRNDGGRFSLRIARSSNNAQASGSKPPSGLSSRSSSRDELRKNSGRHTDAETSSARSRLYQQQPSNKVASDSEHMRPSHSTPLYSLRQSNMPLQRSSSFGQNRKIHNYNFRADASDRLMRGLPTNHNGQSGSASKARIYSAGPHRYSPNQHHQHGMEPSPLSRTATVNHLPIKRPDAMSASMTEKPMCNSPESIASPMSSHFRAPKSRELTALDTLVVSAILQLSHKLRLKMRALLEAERSKFEDADSETRMLIDEILPQMKNVESRLQDGSEAGFSKDISNILKNLKKVEQSIDVLTLLSEIDTSYSSLKQPNQRQVNDEEAADEHQQEPLSPELEF